MHSGRNFQEYYCSYTCSLAVVHSFKLCTTNIFKHIKLKQVSDIYMPADYIMLPIFLFPGNDQINEGLCWVNWFLNLVIKSQ